MAPVKREDFVSRPRREDREPLPERRRISSRKDSIPAGKCSRPLNPWRRISRTSAPRSTAFPLSWGSPRKVHWTEEKEKYALPGVEIKYELKTKTKNPDFIRLTRTVKHQHQRGSSSPFRTWPQYSEDARGSEEGDRPGRKYHPDLGAAPRSAICKGGRACGKRGSGLPKWKRIFRRPRAETGAETKEERERAEEKRRLTSRPNLPK